MITGKAVFFLVFAGAKTGRGHLVRCLILAEETTQKKITPVFLVSNENSHIMNIVKKHGFTCMKTGDNPEAENIITTIKKSGYTNSLLLVDSDEERYYRPEFQRKIVGSGIKLMHITINDTFHYYSHILLNPNIIALSQKFQTEPYTKKLLGPGYFIMNKKFQDSNSRPLPVKTGPPLTLFVAFGGVDHFNLTGLTIDALTGLQHYISQILVVAGPMNRHIESLEKSFKSFTIPVKFFINTSNIKDLMKMTDLAIVSSGLTFWELTLNEVPALMIASSERELKTTQYLHDNSYCIRIGSFPDFPDVRSLNKIFEDILESNSWLKIRTAALKKLIDPAGGRKVAAGISDLLSK